MKIRPKKELLETGAPLEVYLRPYTSPSLRLYRNFLSIHGGAHVYPNVFKLPDELANQSDFGRVHVQFFIPPSKIWEMKTQGIEGVHNDAEFLTIARSSNAPKFHISLQPEDEGSIYYWEPFGDGVQFIHAAVADNFVTFLSMLVEDPDMGSAPPWNRMENINDAPAIDFDVSQLAV